MGQLVNNFLCLRPPCSQPRVFVRPTAAAASHEECLRSSSAARWRRRSTSSSPPRASTTEALQVDLHQGTGASKASGTNNTAATSRRTQNLGYDWKFKIAYHFLTLYRFLSLRSGEETWSPTANWTAHTGAHAAGKTRGLLHSVQEGREASVRDAKTRLRSTAKWRIRSPAVVLRKLRVKNSIAFSSKLIFC